MQPAAGLAWACAWACVGAAQYGPDPWHAPTARGEAAVPPDLRPLPPRVSNPVATMPSSADWFFKRLLIILLRNGRLETNEDGSKDISVQLKLPLDQWGVLEEYISLERPLSEDMYRRSVGYIADAIYKPTFTEKVVEAWSDYVMFYFNWYKVEIMWLSTASAGVLSIMFMSKYITRKILLPVIFMLLFLYEAFISFKEVEKQDYDKFMSAIKWCKWNVWSSDCEMPMPDPIVFLKHMHPGKIFIRLCTLLVTEPIILISSSVNTICHGITDGIWPPFNIVANAVLVVIFNILFLAFFLMIIFNFVLNIPFNVSFFAGLINLGMNNRQDTQYIHSNVTNSQLNNQSTSGPGDSLTGSNLQHFLHIMSNAVGSETRKGRKALRGSARPHESIVRSLSAGRVMDSAKNMLTFSKTKKSKKKDRNGGGDGL